MAGTLLLWAGNNIGRPLSLIDALFTSTSAVCVTGLVVVDTGGDLVVFSQLVVLLLMQLGGLGVMTATTALPLLWGGRIGLRQRFVFAGQMGVDTPSGAVSLLGRVLKMTLV
ncbi:MAG: potassium transporter Trk, partial [Synergistota bacterium]|nr:potassium transporter Trk [Synergistota bacterium]